MSKLGIGTGITPDDGNGDSLLDGAVKINSNFNEIYSYFGDGTNLSGSWQKVSSGINTTLNVGVGTTNPRFTLEVGAVGASGTSLYVNGNARVTGILTVGSSSITLDGSNNILKVGTGVTIYGNSGIVSATDFYAGGMQVGVITASTIIYEGATLYNAWQETSAGINTLSNVGIGTTNPTSALTVSGLTSTTTLFSTNSATIDGLLISQDSISGTGNIRLGDSNTLGVSGSGNYNIGIGQQALDNINGGDYNIAIGYQASQQANIGDIGAGNNISIGYQAFKNLRSGSTNVVIGNQSLHGTTNTPSSAGGNVSIGNAAGYNARSVRFNALIGENSGYNLDIGDWNTFLGWQSGYNITSGNYNIYLGSVNGKYSSVGENRIVIGNGNGSFFNREFDAPTSGSKQLAIGFNTSGTSEYWLVGNSSLNIGIGNTNPQYKLDVGGSINFTGTLYQNGVEFSGGGGSSGVGVQDDGSSVGTATTINFGTGLSVSTVSAGIVTVTAIPTNNFYDGGIVTGNIVLTTANKNQLVPVSTGSSISITLPTGSGLSPGDGFTIVDVGSSETSSGNAATFNITVTPNVADRIMGGTGPLIIDENGASVKLVWMGSTYDWRIV